MDADVPAFARGVRLKRQAGGAILLVPEGIVTLNPTAAAALALVDGTRTVGEIAATLGNGGFAAPDGESARDVRDLFARLRARHLLR